MPIASENDWDHFIARNPGAHLLQTSPWGRFKSAFGWDVIRVVAGDVGAQILFKSLPLGLRMAYIPKGPVGQSWEKLWPEVDEICKKRRAIFLKVESDLWEGDSDSHWAGEPPPGFRLSPQSIQPQRTLLVDLRGSEDEILSRMKQKTRYNIRLASRKGVIVQPSTDLTSFYRLMQVTGERETFGVHSLAYYQQAYDHFAPRRECQLLTAEYEGQILAALMVFARGSRSWYFYGASSDQQRNLMPTYLLQWEAMRWAREQGCTQYDLWGVPDEGETTLESEFTSRQDGLWGVYRFKRGFGGALKRALGPWDRIYRLNFYYFYQIRVKINR